MIPHLGFHPELVSYVSTGDLFTCSHLLSYRTSYQGSVRNSGQRRVIVQDVLNPGYESCDFLIVVLTQHYCFTLGGCSAVELRQQGMVCAVECPPALPWVDLVSTALILRLLNLPGRSGGDPVKRGGGCATHSFASLMVPGQFSMVRCTALAPSRLVAVPVVSAPYSRMSTSEDMPR